MVIESLSICCFHLLWRGSCEVWGISVFYFCFFPILSFELVMSLKCMGNTNQSSVYSWSSTSFYNFSTWSSLFFPSHSPSTFSFLLSLLLSCFSFSSSSSPIVPPFLSHCDARWLIPVLVTLSMTRKMKQANLLIWALLAVLQINQHGYLEFYMQLALAKIKK